MSATMQPAAYLEFAPPRPPGRLPSFGIALAAHLVLIAALTWGVGWKRQATQPAFEAEIWAAVPQEAAPRAVSPPPVPPAPKVQQPPPPQQREADIALEKEKKAKLERERKEAQDRKKAADDEKRRKEQEAKRREEAEAKELERQREDNLRRMAGLAGASGAPSSSGSALQSAGPSGTYAGRIMARIKPNIVFPERDSIPGNPATEVIVRLAPDGTIVGKRVSKSSGVKAWDEAVLRALDKTAVLPRDTDGRVVPEFPISFRPKDF